MLPSEKLKTEYDLIISILKMRNLSRLKLVELAHEKDVEIQKLNEMYNKNQRL